MPRVIELDGERMTEDGKGGWRKLYESELASLGAELPSPLNENVREAFVDEMGVTLGQRLLLKNFAQDNEAAKKYLSALGYEVREYAGRSYYRGPAVTTSRAADVTVQDVIRATEVRLQWDNLGLDFIVYPA